MVKLRTIGVGLLLGAAAVAVLAPPAAATNYTVCAPTNVVCVAQSDGAAWDCSEGYLAWYGPQYARDGVFVNGPAGIVAEAWVGELCARWHKWSTDQYGATTSGAAGSAASWNVGWWHYWHKAAPNCAYGSYSDEGNQLYGAVTVLGATYGANWVGGQRTACGPTGPFCSTTLLVGAVTTQNLGCPLGGPPAPPSPSTFPYGNVLP